jgi:hypothetical protein
MPDSGTSDTAYVTIEYNACSWVQWEPYRPEQPEERALMTMYRAAPEDESENREEAGMIDRQVFLDALLIEERSVTHEMLETVRSASREKWELFVARLLARAFVAEDLAMLKKAPDKVTIVKED